MTHAKYGTYGQTEVNRFNPITFSSSEKSGLKLLSTRVRLIEELVLIPPGHGEIDWSLNIFAIYILVSQCQVYCSF